MDAKHPARKLAGQFFATTCLRQLERLEHTRSTQDKCTEWARRVCKAAKACRNSGVFHNEDVLTTQEICMFNLLSMYALTKRGVRALSPCVYLTSKVRGEYYYRTCEVRHTKMTHVTSMLKVRHKYLLRCIVRLYQS